MYVIVYNFLPFFHQIRLKIKIEIFFLFVKYFLFFICNIVLIQLYFFTFNSPYEKNNLLLKSFLYHIFYIRATFPLVLRYLIRNKAFYSL